MARVVLIPGLAVRTYAEPAAAALAARGHDAELLPAPGWRGQAVDLEDYAERLAERLGSRAREVDLLVGLSVGTQAAAAAAARSRRIRALLLVSPTVDPANRAWSRLLPTWLRGDPRAADPPLRLQASDWTQAGVPRIVAGLRSCLRSRPLEQVVPALRAELTVVHAEFDSLGTVEWAEELADRGGGRLLVAERAPHSWPWRDTTTFADLVDRLVA